MSRHQDELTLLGKLAKLLHLRAAHRRRLFDEHVLPRLERALRELEMRRNGRCDDHCFERVVGEQLVELSRRARVRVTLAKLPKARLVRVAQPCEIGDPGEVPNEVLTPLPETGLTDPDPRYRAHSFQTFPFCTPFLPVAFRRSTTSCASSTTCS